MAGFLTQFVSFALSIITSVSLLFAPLTNGINLTSFAFAESFDKIAYDENRLVPTEDSDGWVFNTDRPLKVVQLTDIHIGGGLLSKSFDRKAMNAVAAMLTYEKPDLVVLTGDMVYPVPFQGGTLNNEVSTKILITLLEKLGVYYAPLFGNHDTEAYSTHTREQIGDVWSSDELEYSLFKKGPEDVDGVGNYIIKVKNSQGIVKNALFCIDSNDYPEDNLLGLGGNYDNIHENQIEWYRTKVNEIHATNTLINPAEPMFTSLAFFHIPLEEYSIAWEEYKANGKDTENVKYISGEHREDTCCSENSDMFFETIEELGSTKALFCGHDHINTGVIEYKGVKLVYGMSIDYIAYVDPVTSLVGYQRGCTVINVDGSEIDVSIENYYQDKYESKYCKETVSMN